MRGNIAQTTLPIVTSGVNRSAPNLDASPAFDGLVIQFRGIAGGGTYKIMGSLDNGTTWYDITKTFADVPTGVALAADVSADSMVRSIHPFPGVVSFLCTHVGTGTPFAFVGFQDSRTQ